MPVKVGKGTFYCSANCNTICAQIGRACIKPSSSGFSFCTALRFRFLLEPVDGSWAKAAELHKCEEGE